MMFPAEKMNLATQVNSSFVQISHLVLMGVHTSNIHQMLKSLHLMIIPKQNDMRILATSCNKT